MHTLQKIVAMNCSNINVFLNHMLYLWSTHYSLVAQSLKNQSCSSDVQFRCLVGGLYKVTAYILLDFFFFFAHFYYIISAGKLPQLSAYWMSFSRSKAFNPKISKLSTPKQQFVKALSSVFLSKLVPLVTVGTHLVTGVQRNCSSL